MNNGKTMADCEYRREIGELDCPSCRKSMVRSVVSLTTDREVWKCRHCGLETEYIDEIQFAIPPPLESAPFIRFLRQVNESLQSNIVQMMGSCEGGCAVTIHLARPTLLANILAELGDMCDVESTREKPLAVEGHFDLLKRAEALRGLENNDSKTIFITLKNR